jgi:hypothetical protein
MGVDEARHCGSAGKINDAGRRLDERLNLRVGAHGKDTSITNGQGLCDLEPSVDGDDLAVAEDKRRRLGHVGHPVRPIKPVTVGVKSDRLETSMAEFWFMMQIAMLCGFCTSYPVNWWLLRLGIKDPM